MESGPQDLPLKAANAIGTTAGYIQTRYVQEMISDAEEVARRNPVPALIGAAAALGLVLGAFRRRDRQKYEAVK